MRQPWRCDLCKATGSVPYRKDAGVWEVVQKIGDAHRRKSPACSGGRWSLRIVDKAAA